MTVRETLIPTAMVPGLVTVEDKEGNRQNLHPIDAKELIAAGEHKLVENGAVEAARIAATPLRSGMATNIPSDQIVAEIAGIAGMVVMGNDAAEAEKIKSGAAGEDGTKDDKSKAPKSAREQDGANAQKSAAQPKSDAEKAAERAKAEDKK